LFRRIGIRAYGRLGGRWYGRRAGFPKSNGSAIIVPSGGGRPTLCVADRAQKIEGKNPRPAGVVETTGRRDTASERTVARQRRRLHSVGRHGHDDSSVVSAHWRASLRALRGFSAISWTPRTRRCSRARPKMAEGRSRRLIDFARPVERHELRRRIIHDAAARRYLFKTGAEDQRALLLSRAVRSRARPATGGGDYISPRARLRGAAVDYESENSVSARKTPTNAR